MVIQGVVPDLPDQTLVVQQTIANALVGHTAKFGEIEKGENRVTRNLIAKGIDLVKLMTLSYLIRHFIGSSGRTRTYNPSVNSRMLCH
jgi:hypothetical protein